MGEERQTPGELYAELRMDEVLAAFERLLETTAYPAVTVTAICAEAGISRPTFYHYFKDKDDIVQWFWNQAGDVYLGQTGKTLGWYEGNLRMLQNFLQRKRFMISVLSYDIGVNSCINHGFRQRVEYLRSLIRSEDPIELTDDVDFEIRFFADAESRTIASWVTSGMVERPEVLARRLEGCVPPLLAKTVNDILSKREEARGSVMPQAREA